jgi:hypothetical protein
MALDRSSPDLAGHGQRLLPVADGLVVAQADHQELAVAGQHAGSFGRGWLVGHQPERFGVGRLGPGTVTRIPAEPPEPLEHHRLLVRVATGLLGQRLLLQGNSTSRVADQVRQLGSPLGDRRAVQPGAFSGIIHLRPQLQDALDMAAGLGDTGRSYCLTGRCHRGGQCPGLILGRLPVHGQLGCCRPGRQARVGLDRRGQSACSRPTSPGNNVEYTASDSSACRNA